MMIPLKRKFGEAEGSKGINSIPLRGHTDFFLWSFPMFLLASRNVITFVIFPENKVSILIIRCLLHLHLEKSEYGYVKVPNYFPCLKFDVEAHYNI